MKPESTSTTKTDEVKEKNSGACPVVEAVEEIGSKWRLVVIHDLQEGEKRFNQLKDSTGASSSTLSRVLDDLEELGIVRRRVEERPIASYYSLTAKGEALGPALDALGDWSKNYL